MEKERGIGLREGWRRKGYRIEEGVEKEGGIRLRKGWRRKGYRIE